MKGEGGSLFAAAASAHGEEGLPVERGQTETIAFFKRRPSVAGYQPDGDAVYKLFAVIKAALAGPAADIAGASTGFAHLLECSRGVAAGIAELEVCVFRVPVHWLPVVCNCPAGKRSERKSPIFGDVSAHSRGRSSGCVVRHGADYQMMKGTDDIEIDWAGPVTVFNHCDHVHAAQCR